MTRVVKVKAPGLRVYSLNAEGIGRTSLGDFLDVFSTECVWDALLVQEDTYFRDWNMHFVNEHMILP